MRIGRLALLALLWVAVLSPEVRGEEPVRVRVGDHPGFGRVVFDFPAVVDYALTRDGDRVTLRFGVSEAIGTPRGYPRNVVGFVGGAGQAEIRVARGSRVQPLRVGNNLAIDVWDPVPAGPTPATEPISDDPAKGPPRAVATVPAPAAAPPPEPRLASPRKATATAPSPLAIGRAAAPPSTAPAVRANAPAPSVPLAPAVSTTSPAQAPSTAPAAQAPSPMQAAPPTPPTAPPPPEPSRPATRLADPLAVAPLALVATRGPAGSVRLPFGTATGAAAFRRGTMALLVFDERRPIDLAGLRDDPVFSSAVVQLLPEATVVRLALPAGAGLALERTADGWIVTAGAQAAHLQAITLALADRRVTLRAGAAGRVLSVVDPETGAMLLVGTQREPGEAVSVPHRTSEFVLLPTWQGVALEPLADSVFLKAAKTGFVLGAEPAGLALAAPSADAEAYAAASALTRRYDFPPLAPEVLVRRLQGEVDAVAAAPPLGRARGRRAAAASLIALGLGAEAQSMLRLAAAEDAREVGDADAAGLAAIAALLAGRGAEADGLDDPRLDGTDEIALWRAVRQAVTNEGSPAAAQVFGATLPLLLAYPQGLRDRLLPLAAETMALNDVEAAGPLLSRWPDEPRLKLARGLWRHAQGDRDGALALFDQLATGPDRLTRVRAAVRAVELRLEAGLVDAHQAADALEHQLYAWRGDRRELDLRARAAQLRAEAGEWRPALALLREAETLDQDERPAMQARLIRTFASLLEDRNADRLAPLDLVTLLDENADLLPDGEPGTEIASRLADRLVALDLPRRADAVLAKLVAATAGPVRASFGARLAGLRLREGNAAAALTTLADTDADGLPEPVQQQRMMVRAGALARRGDPTGAARLLAEIGTRQASEQRAAILEEARDWPMAEQALVDYAARTVPPDGPLDDGQRRVLLRLAGATTQAGDAAALSLLGEREGTRMAGGPLGDMFRLLTASPVQRAGDLPRAAQEIALARSLPSGLKAMVVPRDSP